MNFKLDLNLVNTILMVIILIVVIVACVRKSRENFDPYFLDTYCKDSNDLSCLRGSDGASVGSLFEDTWKDLNEMKNLKEWAKSDDGILDNYFPSDGNIGRNLIELQIKMNQFNLINIFTRILQSFNVSQDESKIQSLGIIENNALVYVTLVGDKWTAKDTIINYIKTYGQFNNDTETKINRLTYDNIPSDLLNMPETNEDERDLKKKKYEKLLSGGDTASTPNYVINDEPGNAINFTALLSDIINEDELELQWVKTLTNGLNIDHFKLALSTIMSQPEIEEYFNPK